MARLPAVFLFLVFAASRVGFFLQVLGLAVERPHGVDGLVDPLDQPLALSVGEAQLAHRVRNAYDRPRQSDPVLRWSWDASSGNRGEFLLQLPGFLVGLGQVVDLPGEFLQPVLKNFVGDLFLVEGDHFLDRADALLKVFAHGQQFANDNRERESALSTRSCPRSIRFAISTSPSRVSREQSPSRANTCGQGHWFFPARRE